MKTKDGGERRVVRWYELFPLRRLAESAAGLDVYSPVASSIAEFPLDRERRRKTRVEGLSLSFSSPSVARPRGRVNPLWN